MGGGKRPSPQANIRWQACLLQGKSHLAFVGASLLANLANERASLRANIRWQASSYRGKASLCL
jgi:hypothetical protein